jgi:hypothetical protein
VQCQLIPPLLRLCFGMQLRTAKTLLPFFSLCLVSLLLSGCIHLEQRVKINSDGSGVVTYDYSVAEETFGTVATGRMAIGEWQKRPQAGLNWFTNERAVNRFFAGKKLEVQYYRMFRKGGRRHVRVIVLAPDLRAALATGKLGDFRLDQTADGNGRFRRLPPAKPQAKKLSEEDVARLRALCDDLWLRLVVETPTDVLSATSTDRKGKQITWAFDPGSDDSFLRKRPEIEVVYKGKD